VDTTNPPVSKRLGFAQIISYQLNLKHLGSMNLFSLKVLLTSVIFSVFKLSLAAQIPIAALRDLESTVTTAVCTFEVNIDTSLTADRRGRVC